MHEEIINKLDVKKLCSSNVFNIVDLGCSAGKTAFVAVENIIKAVNHRCQSEGISSEKLEYQVFFNDQVSNDFNTLFKSLPFERVYFAAGVPGSFRGRLFPRGSLQFAHSSYALHWLSEIPKEVQDSSSPAWNKGKISYETKEVEEAYAGQFVRDIECFLEARAEEVQCGGFIAMLMLSEQEGPDRHRCSWNRFIHLLGCTLVDLASMGLLDESKIDSFNVPVYAPSPVEVETIIQRNGFFKIHKIEKWDRYVDVDTRPTVEQLSLIVRAVIERCISEHFGDEIIDQLFDRYKEKLAESNVLSDPKYLPTSDLFVLVERM